MQRRYYLSVFVLLLLGLGIGYAAMSTNLNITGTTVLKDNRWDIHLENVQVRTGSVTASTPTINTAKDTVTYSVDLNNLGDYYEFTVDAKNDGSLNGMISNISSKLNGNEITTLPAALSYSVTYSDDVEINNNHLLAVGEKVSFKIRVGYRTDINISDIPSSSQTLNLAFTVTYIQATGSAVEKPRGPVYTVSAEINNIGSVLSNGTVTFDNYYDALAAHQYPFFLKFNLNTNNILTDAAVGFILNNNIYYLHGAGATYNNSTNTVNDDSIYYATNREVVQRAFGNNCDDYTFSMTCHAPKIQVGITANGFVYIDYDETWYCYVGADGDTGCAHDT